MSSDSEFEDFYDAYDETPDVSVQLDDPATVQHARPSALWSQDQKLLLEIEKEEEELLLMKRRVEERRRHEDDEIAARMARLSKHKTDVQLATDHVQERCSDDSSPESRMSKLQRLREQMSEDSYTPHLDSPSVDVRSHGDDDVASNQRDTAVTAASLDCGVSCDVSSGDALECTEDEGNKWTDEDLHALVREACEATSRSVGLNKNGDPANKTPKDVGDMSTSAYVVSGVASTRIDVQYDCSPDEPDIVKSTRVTPPQTLTVAPVAPPRRKKKTASTTNEDSDPGTPTPSSETPPRATPCVPASRPKPPRPTHGPCARQAAVLLDDVEHSLDVDSAIGGSRHIHVDDVEVDATNNSRPSSRINSLERGVLLRKASAESPTGTLAGYLSDSLPLTRPRSNSGRSLTDQEILESVMVLNLDTGEQVPLSVAEEKLPQCVNPLALHIMRRTKEYTSHSSLNKEQGASDDDDYDTKSEGGKSTGSLDTISTKLKTDKLKKFIGKSVKSSVKKVRQVAEQSKKGIAGVLEGDDTEMENEVSVDGKKFKFKRSRGNKGPYSFAQFRILQDLSGHTGAIWTMKFSPCGRLLASGGQDNMLRVWVLKAAYIYFDEMRVRSNDANVISQGHSQDSIDSGTCAADTSDTVDASDTPEVDERKATFMKKPFWVYRGHTADLLDIAWSKNNFILSSSMDKTVRLWHISRRECLCTFQHIDFVTAIVFHPRDDRYFLSGSLDGNLRLWNIPDKKVTLRNEVSGQSSLITTANFCDNGRYAVVGMYDGRCILFHTDKFKYYTQINVRSTRGKNRGRKVTGVEPIRLNNKNLMLVTSNDSRIRLYDLRDLTLTCKFKGHINNSSQIKASFSGNGQSIICGSEDHFVYVWKTQHDYHKMSSARRDRNHYWEAIKVHNAVVTAAIFASKPELFSKTKLDSLSKDAKLDKGKETTPGEIIVSADFNGLIKIVQNQASS